MAIPGRCLGIDLSPNWIGIAAVKNIKDPRSVETTSMLEHALVKLDMAMNASPAAVRETLAAVCDRAVSVARNHRCGTIALEKGLGKLRSSGRSRALNRVLNYWARTVFVAMLSRRARLAGIDVIKVWAGYSSTIGNLAFEIPDACASATEIARRGIARLAGMKDFLPALDEGCVPVYGGIGRCPPNLARGRRSIGQSKRRRLATAARTPTCRSALGVPMSTGQRCSAGMRSSAKAEEALQS